jgi:hypothetical protein
MEVHPNLTVAVLSDVVHRSGYLCLLGVQPQQIGIRVDGETFLLNVKDGQASVSLHGQSSDKAATPLYWIECSRSALEAARNSGKTVEGLAIKPGVAGKSIHPIMERVSRRFFEAPPFPLDDRDELIYPALLGITSSPTVFWESKRNVLRILRYGPYLVTSGLSEPWFRTPQLFSSEKVSGIGYELLTKSTDSKVEKEFTSWVEHVERGGEDIAPGNWLEFEAIATIPKGEMAGFLVVAPLDLPPQFPVGTSQAYWHQLVPITGLELEAAKCYSAFKGEQTGIEKRRPAESTPQSKEERSKKTVQLLQALDNLPDTDEEF